MALCSVNPCLSAQGSDYPHLDAYRDPIKELRENLKEVPEADQRKVLGENALKVYGLLS